MPFRLRYQVQIDFVGAGAGPMEAMAPTSGQMLPGGGATGQSKEFVTNPAAIPIVLGSVGTFPANQLNSTDVTTLLTGLTTDISAQMNAALPTINQWPSGGP
jgi:hypothetical protein